MAYRLWVNGESVETSAATLEELLGALDIQTPVATALNEVFVPQTKRAATSLQGGDRVEILSPMQGG